MSASHSPHLYSFRFTGLFSAWNRKQQQQQQKNLEENPSFFYSFLFFFKFKAQCLSTLPSGCLSPLYKCVPIASYKLLDRLACTPPPTGLQHLSDLSPREKKKKKNQPYGSSESDRRVQNPMLNNEQSNRNNKKDNRFKKTREKKSLILFLISVFLKIKSYPPAGFGKPVFLNKH